MGENHVSFIGDEFVRRNLFDSQNEISMIKLLLNNSATFFVLEIREDSLFGGLYNDCNIRMFLKNLLDMSRDKRGSPLPHAFVLPPDSYRVNLLIHFISL